jgi:two-component system, NtrC family, nitrogen regulation sensor histidine kinase NtrY
MMYKNIIWKLAIKVLLLFTALFLAAYLLVREKYVYAFFTIPIILFLLYDIYKMLRKVEAEVKEFAESVHYRDFSRHFNITHTPVELQGLREGFNEINSTFKEITKEKELQYQYMQQILELVETGILSFVPESGEVNWMNNTFKKMFDIPYLKNIMSLQKRDAQLYDEVMAIRPRQSTVITIVTENRKVKIILSASIFLSDGKKNKLIAFQNINEALDENEAKAWQKLLGVMTHEIMNSVAPISSLADTLKKRLPSTNTQNKDDNNEWEDLELGLETIKRRSEGLLKFAETYRNLNKITRPNLKKAFARDLFENLQTLMQPTLDQKNIELEIILKDPELMIDIDTNLIEQVLINLITNAIEAVTDIPKPKIILSALQENNKAFIKIVDNGKGIPSEVLDQIFIPFFSTKKSGSGIGLSLCKQIMLLHKGNIQVQSIEGKGSAFVLMFSEISYVGVWQ